VLTPLANGTGTLTVSAAGFGTLNIPLTVALGSLDWDTQ
jgi:hypothetical protein